MSNLPNYLYYLYQSEQPIELSYKEGALLSASFPSRTLKIEVSSDPVNTLNLVIEVKQGTSDLDMSLDLLVSEDIQLNDIIEETTYRAEYDVGSCIYESETLDLVINGKAYNYDYGGANRFQPYRIVLDCSDDTILPNDEVLVSEDIYEKQIELNRITADPLINQLFISFLPAGLTTLSFRRGNATDPDAVTYIPDVDSGYLPGPLNSTLGNLTELSEAILYAVASDDQDLVVNLLCATTELARSNNLIERDGLTYRLTENKLPGFATVYERLTGKFISIHREVDPNVRLGLSIIYALRYLQDRKPSDFYSLRGRLDLLPSQLSQVLVLIANLVLNCTDYLSDFVYTRLDEQGNPELEQTAQTTLAANIFLSELLAHRYDRVWHEAAARTYQAINRLPADVTSSVYSIFSASEDVASLALLRYLWSKTHGLTEEQEMLTALLRRTNLAEDSPWLVWAYSSTPELSEIFPPSSFLEPEIVVESGQPFTSFQPFTVEEDDREGGSYLDFETNFESLIPGLSVRSDLLIVLQNRRWQIEFGKAFRLGVEEADLFVNYVRNWETYSWPFGYLWQNEDIVRNPATVLGSLLSAAADNAFETALQLQLLSDGLLNPLQAQGSYLNLWGEAIGLPRPGLCSDRFWAQQLYDFLNRPRTTKSAVLEATEFWGYRPLVDQSGFKLLPVETSSIEFNVNDYDLSLDSVVSEVPRVPSRYALYEDWQEPVLFDYFEDPSQTKNSRVVRFDPKNPDSDLYFYLVYQPNYLDRFAPPQPQDAEANQLYFRKRPVAGFTYALDCSSSFLLEDLDVTLDSDFAVVPLQNYVAQFQIHGLGDASGLARYLNSVVPVGVVFKVEKFTLVKT